MVNMIVIIKFIVILLQPKADLSLIVLVINQ